MKLCGGGGKSVSVLSVAQASAATEHLWSADEWAVWCGEQRTTTSALIAKAVVPLHEQRLRDQALPNVRVVLLIRRRDLWYVCDLIDDTSDCVQEGHDGFLSHKGIEALNPRMQRLSVISASKMETVSSDCSRLLIIHIRQVLIVLAKAVQEQNPMVLLGIHTNRSSGTTRTADEGSSLCIGAETTGGCC